MTGKLKLPENEGSVELQFYQFDLATGENKKIAKANIVDGKFEEQVTVAGPYRAPI